MLQQLNKLIKKELSFYFNNPLGYIVVCLFAIIANFLFMKDVFLRDDTSMRPFFDTVPFLLLFFAPALSMRIFSEEEKSGTLETLLSLPVKEELIVLAKLIALSLCFAGAFLLTLSVPISLFFLGKINVSLLISQYIGAYFLTVYFLAISLFFSLFSKNQVIVFIISLLFIFIIFTFSSAYYYEQFLRGLLDTRAITYFIVLTSLISFASIRKLKNK